MDKKVEDIIFRISNEHSHKKFGYLTEEDLKNEIWVICLEKLKDFDYSRGELEHFLRVSVHNRLVNKFKEITKSVRPPCPRCRFFKEGEFPDCGKFGENKDYCDKWRAYQISIESRNSLLNAAEDKVERKEDQYISDRIAAHEIKDLVSKYIGRSYRNDFNRMVAGEKISKQRLKKLKVEIYRILEVLKNKTTPLTINGEAR